MTFIMVFLLFCQTSSLFSPKLNNTIPKINYPLQARWISENDVFVVDSSFSPKTRKHTNRVVKIDLAKKKIIPIFNGDLNESRVWCRLSDDCRFLCALDVKNYKVRIIQDGKVIYQQRLEEVIDKDKLTSNSGMLMNWSLPFYVDDKRVIIILGNHSSHSGFSYRCLIDLDYCENKVLNFIDLEKHNCVVSNLFPIVKIFGMNVPDCIFFPGNNSCYYDISQKKIKAFKPGRTVRVGGHSIQKMGGFYLFFNINSTYTAFKNLKPIEKVLSENTWVSGLFISKKHIVVKAVSKTICSSEYIYKIYDKGTDPRLLESIEDMDEKSKVFISVSPFDGKILFFDNETGEPLVIGIDL